jgi:hypothetical protein
MYARPVVGSKKTSLYPLPLFSNVSNEDPVGWKKGLPALFLYQPHIVVAVGF